MSEADRLQGAARTAAYRLLARRSRSIRELTIRLMEKGFPEAVVTAVIDRFRELRYLDDAAVARQWARSYAVNSLWGDRKIQARLLDMGIPEELVQGAVEEARKEVTQREAILKILEKQSPERLTAPAISVKEKQRLIRHLAAKGFPLSVIYDVLDHPVKESDSVDGQ
ncbi:MAG: recombination regulator RecX [Syntrophales bacterium]|jgi:regulatory protein|nr:recombination regulator RecX [Syntrophales bacterium]MCK9528149.1 recombination regulator RecX [Syntrophales bacterium]MDX9921119.1 regulatory protein RecX [Syntrophales bacterium]